MATTPERNLPEHLDRRGTGRGVYLGTDRRGRPVAYRCYRDRAFRMPRAEAELYVATGQARQLTRREAFFGPHSDDE